MGEWRDDEDYRGAWQKFVPDHPGDWPSGEGVPERCCEGIVARRRVTVEAPPETLSPGVKAWLDLIPRKDGQSWRYEVFHDTHCLAKHVLNPSTNIPKLSTGDAFEPYDGKAKAAGE